MNLYFDNAATSWPKPDSVSEGIKNTMDLIKGNPGRTSGKSSIKILFRTRMALAALFNISDPSRILFTLNATHAINTALLGLLKHGDSVVTSSMEHNAVSRPLNYLALEQGIDLEVLQASPRGYLDPEDVRRALRKPTTLLIINHASNICGALQDLESIGAVAEEAGVPFMVDAAQSAGAVPVDVQACKIDILAAPGHKSLLGPSGTGFLYLGPGYNGKTTGVRRYGKPVGTGFSAGILSGQV